MGKAESVAEVMQLRVVVCMLILDELGFFNIRSEVVYGVIKAREVETDHAE